MVWHGGIVEVRDAGGLRQQTTFGPVGWPADRLGGALAFISFGLTALVGSLWAIVKRHDRRHQRAAAMVRWHGVALGVTAILSVWAQLNNNWPMWAIWAIWAIWGPLALVLLATMVASAIAALRSNGEGYGLFTEPPVLPSPPARPAARESSVAPGSGGLPREYRMSRGRRNGLLAVLVAKAALLLFMVWSEDIPPFWLQLGTSVLVVPTVIVCFVRVPRTATLIDSAGIRVRGITHTRRVAWEDVQDIRAEPVRGSDGSFVPRVVVYAYLTVGGRKLLKHVDDQEYDVDREIAVLRAAWAGLHRRTPRRTYRPPNRPAALPGDAIRRGQDCSTRSGTGVGFYVRGQPMPNRSYASRLPYGPRPWPPVGSVTAGRRPRDAPRGLGDGRTRRRPRGGSPMRSWRLCSRSIGR
ncbi:hypothetical protein OG594_44575 [Streptomyces sp. NBC_01214]|uniref:hypothetical protein n=1 Tax=Streptomyces sp. NBC_01214 TaxID=2903777 RepID=UPI002256CD32|nr:hypothetical protein [Streptomyces sp. NBC_01214]MCX4808580.1 hypothetical protein [Streptomyces sp. NBC_01214]